MYTFLYNEKLTTLTEEELQSVISDIDKEDFIKSFALTSEDIEIYNHKMQFKFGEEKRIYNRSVSANLYKRIIKKLGINKD